MHARHIPLLRIAYRLMVLGIRRAGLRVALRGENWGCLLVRMHLLLCGRRYRRVPRGGVLGSSVVLHVGGRVPVVGLLILRVVGHVCVSLRYAMPGSTEMSLMYAIWRRRSLKYYPRCATDGTDPARCVGPRGKPSRSRVQMSDRIECCAGEVIGTLGVEGCRDWGDGERAETRLKSESRNDWLRPGAWSGGEISTRPISGVSNSQCRAGLTRSWSLATMNH